MNLQIVTMETSLFRPVAISSAVKYKPFDPTHAQNRDQVTTEALHFEIVSKSLHQDLDANLGLEPIFFQNE